ncbi:MAG: hypothetical protein KBE09_04950, partial [Candidatus Pacebacteria bacterium]|nr:hypothetical protein [Candidatus Paceibacterota bacterium]
TSTPRGVDVWPIGAATGTLHTAILSEHSAPRTTSGMHAGGALPDAHESILFVNTPGTAGNADGIVLGVSTENTPTPAPIGSIVSGGAGGLFAVSGSPQGGAASDVGGTPPPAPVVTGPSDGSIVRTASVTVSGTAEDGTVELSYPLEGGGEDSIRAETVDGLWSISVPLYEGVHQLRVAVGTATGMSGDTDFSVHVDLTPDAPFVEGPLEGHVQNTPDVVVHGTTTAAFTVHIDTGAGIVDATADAEGNWTATTTLPEGDTTLSITADDNDGHVSPAVTRTVTIDLTAPLTAFPEVADCASSLSESFCFVASTTVSVSWPAADGAAYYGLTANNDFQATTTELNGRITLRNEITNRVKIVSYDAAGNVATSSAVTVYAYVQPLLINEVAWAGSLASSDHQWFEIKNRTPFDVTLAHVRLNFDNTDVLLEGLLPAASISVRDDLVIVESIETAAGPASATTTTLAFPSAGAKLFLVHHTAGGDTTMDMTPEVATCSGWCAGASDIAFGHSETLGTRTARLSMERTDGALDGTLASSWHSNDGYTTWGFDANGTLLTASAKLENSVGYPGFGWFCGSDALVADGSTYTPSSGTCTSLSGFIHNQAQRSVAFFKGIPGTSMLIQRYTPGNAKFEQADFLPTDLVPGDQLFLAIWEERSTAPDDDRNDFLQWFQTGTTTTDSPDAPHSNYRVLRWVLGG